MKKLELTSFAPFLMVFARPILAYLKSGRIYLTPGQRYAIVGDDWASYYIIDLKDRKIVETKVFVKENLYPAIPMEYFYLAPKPPGL
jgi:hypothetical protein